MIIRFLLGLIVIVATQTVHAHELDDYFNFKGGYEITPRDDYTVFVDSKFTEFKGTLSEFGRVYLDSETLSPIQDTYLMYIDSAEGMSIVPFKPTLVALIMANIPLELDEIVQFDTSLDAGFFVANGDVLGEGLITFHGFTKSIMGSLFYKTIHVRFNENFMSKRLANLKPETLEQFLL